MRVSLFPRIGKPVSIELTPSPNYQQKMKRNLLTPLLIISIGCWTVSCNNDCDCTQIVQYYNASGIRVDEYISDIRDDCGKQDSYTEQASEGTKKTIIICEPW
jgi:hypothetical protein